MIQGGGRVAQERKSFERLSDILEHIEDDQIAEAVAAIRERRVGKRAADIQQPLGSMLEQLENHELMWLEMVLCVRAQQTGREGAWRRFAESSHREFVPFYR
jgi:hypothetical protein